MWAYLRTSIKGKKSSDENKTSKSSKWDRVALHFIEAAIFGKPSFSRTYHGAANKSTDTSKQMNNSAASKVMIPFQLQPAFVSPSPMRDDRINEC